MISTWLFLAAREPREMTLAAWLMLVVAVMLLLGGLMVCIRIAVKVDRRKAEEGVSHDDEG